MSAVVVATLWACLQVGICMPIQDYDRGHLCVAEAGQIFLNDEADALKRFRKAYPQLKKYPDHKITFECRRDT